MGMVLIYGLIILLILLISAPIIYFIFKRIGKPKLGMFFATLIILFVAILVFTNNIDEILYSKSDAKVDLKLANLVLYDDFEIIKNEVVGMPERFQKTEIKISERDKIRIINEIKSGKSFRKSENNSVLFPQLWYKGSPRNKVIFTNYFIDNQYIRESYYRQNDYVPILMQISLTANSKLLQLSRTED